MNDFFDTVRRFLLDYLPKQRCLSENTILSYKQTLNLFVSYMQDERDVTATKLTFSRIDRDVILGFLTWLETARKCSASTRNQRLMALRSFLEFAGQMDCTQMALYLSACNIPSKESHGRIVEFLTEPSLAALLQQPDPSKPKDLRNLVFMILMYDTAARCSELLDMEAHLDEPLTISALSRRACLSATIFKAGFRRLYGLPVHAWLRQRRMERAAELLRDSSLSVLGVAQSVGYSSASQFTAAFRRQYGVTPAQYRKNV